YLIAGNVIAGRETAITLTETTEVVIRECDLQAETALELKRSAHTVRVERCDLRGAHAVAAEPGSWAAMASCYVEGELPWDAEHAAPAETPFGPPVLPVRPMPADAASRDDQGFRW